MNKEFKGLQELVYKELENHPNTRNSDMILYVNICETLNPSATLLPFSTGMRKSNEFGFPKWESVSRIRRKLQAKYPSLRAEKRITEGRFQKWKDFREYAKE